MSCQHRCRTPRSHHLLAFAGYLITFWSARMLARRRDKLDWSTTAQRILRAAVCRLGGRQHRLRSLLKSRARRRANPSRETEGLGAVDEHHLHAAERLREKIIIENAHLIVEEKMPQCLLDFVTHVVGYKAVLAKWADGDFRRTPLHHRLAAGIRCVCAQSYAPQSRTDAPDAQPARPAWQRLMGKNRDAKGT